MSAREERALRWIAATSYSSKPGRAVTVTSWRDREGRWVVVEVFGCDVGGQASETALGRLLACGEGRTLCRAVEAARASLAFRERGNGTASFVKTTPEEGWNVKPPRGARKRRKAVKA